MCEKYGHRIATNKSDGKVIIIISMDITRRTRKAIMVITSSTGYSITHPEIILTRLLKEHDLIPVVICPEDGSLAHFFREQAIRVEILPNINRWRNLVARLTAVSTIGKLIKIAADYDTILVHAARLSATPFAVKLAKKLNVPCISHLHGVPPGPDKFRRYLTHQADILVAVSEGALAACPSQQKDRATVVYNGMDITDFRARSVELNAHALLGVGNNLLVGMAGLNACKGVDVFIEAAGSVAAIMPEVRFLLLGRQPEGKTWKIISEQVEKAGISDKVIFPGYQKNAAAFMAAADIWVVPSRVDAAPMVVMEAMTLGKPVVGSNVGGIPELIQNGGTGYIVPTEDSTALASAIKELLVDGTKRNAFGTSGLKWAENNFSYNGYEKRMWNVYQKLLNKSGALRARGGVIT